MIFPVADVKAADDAITWEGCEFSKCGRTDRGVSAFGQVVGLKVRSNRPLKRGADEELPQILPPEFWTDATTHSRGGMDAGGHDNTESSSESPWYDNTYDELPYIKILNRVLPEDIRVLAWCPSPPDFSARFSCRERRYRYFFTQPSFKPPVQLQSNHQSNAVNGRKETQGYLNIEAMQSAAKKFEGVHDFRNFCKIDPSKQIENFQRKIFRSKIIAVNPPSPPSNTGPPALPPLEDTITGTTLAHQAQTYAFILHGSAFLWHQVRHMVAILFLIGQGLESPTLIDDLLDIAKTPSKPRYDIADDAPLVLWDCVFPTDMSETSEKGYEDSLPWITENGQLKPSSYSTSNNATINSNNKKNGGAEAVNKKHYARGAITENIWKVWRKAKIDEVLAGELLDVVAGYHHSASSQQQGQGQGHGDNVPEPRSDKVFLGGNGAKLAGKYVPVMQRPRMESAEIVNARWAQKKKKKDGLVIAEGGGEMAAEV